MNMEFNIKQAIINRLRSTNRENIEVVINYMENNGFFTAQCEPHHTYKGGIGFSRLADVSDCFEIE